MSNSSKKQADKNKKTPQDCNNCSNSSASNCNDNKKTKNKQK